MLLWWLPWWSATDEAYNMLKLFMICNRWRSVVRSLILVMLLYTVHVIAYFAISK
jgi:hypothetical protein